MEKHVFVVVFHDEEDDTISFEIHATELGARNNFLSVYNGMKDSVERYEEEGSQSGYPYFKTNYGYEVYIEHEMIQE